MVLVVFGALTGFDSPRLSTNLPTPWIGVWERINIGAYVVWVIVLAVALLRNRPTGTQSLRSSAFMHGRVRAKVGAPATTFR